MAVTPDVESIRKARESAEVEDAFWRDHYDELLRQFPDMFVAVSRSNGEVIATDSSPDHLLHAIRAAGFTVQQVWVRFLAATPLRVAL